MAVVNPKRDWTGLLTLVVLVVIVLVVVVDLVRCRTFLPARRDGG